MRIEGGRDNHYHFAIARPRRRARITEPRRRKTVFILNSDQMGHGDVTLGQKILATLLRKLPALRGVTAIVLTSWSVFSWAAVNRWWPHRLAGT